MRHSQEVGHSHPAAPQPLEGARQGSTCPTCKGHSSTKIQSCEQGLDPQVSALQTQTSNPSSRDTELSAVGRTRLLLSLLRDLTSISKMHWRMPFKIMVNCLERAPIFLPWQVTANAQRHTQKLNEVNPPIPDGVLANPPIVLSHYDLLMLYRRNMHMIPQIFYRTQDFTYSDTPQAGHTTERGSLPWNVRK